MQGSYRPIISRRLQFDIWDCELFLNQYSPLKSDPRPKYLIRPWMSEDEKEFVKLVQYRSDQFEEKQRMKMELVHVRLMHRLVHYAEGGIKCPTPLNRY